MDNPLQDIYEILQAGDVPVYQDRPEVIKDFPCVTFYLSNNTPDYTLLKAIAAKNYEVVVDIWALKPSDSYEVLIKIEEAMRNENYRLKFNAVVPDPDGYSHLSTRFVY